MANECKKCPADYKEKRYYCVFCGEEIEPEEFGSNYDAWLFQCDNRACGAVYQSFGKVIPNIDVYFHQEFVIDVRDNQ